MSTKTFCDRCGEECAFDKFPYKHSSLTFYVTDKDFNETNNDEELCPQCTEELRAWFKSKPKQGRGKK
jgi:hypothetical protein